MTRILGKIGQRWRYFTMLGICAVCLAIGSGWLVRRERIEALSIECREALAQKQWDQIDDLAPRWLWWDRSHALPWICLAESAQERGDLQTAVDHLGHLPENDPLTPQALFQRAAILFDSLNKPLDAAADLEKAVQLSPTHCEARRRLVFFYAFTLQRARMAQLARESIACGCDAPETYVYLIGQDWLSFANGYEQNSKWLQNDRDQELFLVARTIYRITSKALDDLVAEEVESQDKTTNSDRPEHFQAMEKLAVKFPKNLEVLAYFLRNAALEGDAEKVAELLRQAPPEAQNEGRFWRYKGWLHNYLEEFELSEESYRTALQLNPYDLTSCHQLASVLRSRGKLNEEVEKLEGIAEFGRKLRNNILEKPTVQHIDHQLLSQLAVFARKCGDNQAADRLDARVQAAAGFNGLSEAVLNEP